MWAGLGKVGSQGLGASALPGVFWAQLPLQHPPNPGPFPFVPSPSCRGFVSYLAKQSWGWEPRGGFFWTGQLTSRCNRPEAANGESYTSPYPQLTDRETEPRRASLSLPPLPTPCAGPPL